MPVCGHCGSMLVRATPREKYDLGAQWLCHNENCVLNREAQRQRDIAETGAKRIGTFIFFALVVYAILRALELV